MNWRKQNDRLVSSSMRDLGKLERAANNIKCWDVPCTRGLRPHPFPSSPGHLEFPEIRRPEVTRIGHRRHSRNSRPIILLFNSKHGRAGVEGARNGRQHITRQGSANHRLESKSGNVAAPRRSKRCDPADLNRDRCKV